MPKQNKFLKVLKSNLSVNSYFIPLVLSFAVLVLIFIAFLNFEYYSNYLFYSDSVSRARGEFIKIIIQLFGGLVVVWALWISFRRASAFEKTIKVSEEGNIIERFNSAIGHLGSTENEVTALGGVHSLHRIAQESPKDTETICRLFCSYLKKELGTNNIKESDNKIVVQTIIELLFKGKDNKLYEEFNKDLSEVKFKNFSFKDCTVCRTSFKNSIFNEAVIEYCNFSFVDFSRSDFKDVYLKKSTFCHCNLKECSFKITNFKKLSLNDIDFTNSLFEYVSFISCDLKNVDLTFTQCTEFVLDSCELGYLQFNSSTINKTQIINSNIFADIDFENAIIKDSTLANNKGLNASYFYKIYSLNNVNGIDNIINNIKKHNPKAFK